MARGLPTTLLILILIIAGALAFTYDGNSAYIIGGLAVTVILFSFREKKPKKEAMRVHRVKKKAKAISAETVKLKNVTRKRRTASKKAGKKTAAQKTRKRRAKSKRTRS